MRRGYAYRDVAGTPRRGRTGNKTEHCHFAGRRFGLRRSGFPGGTEIATPHIDALASNGVRFTNGYVSGAYCSPTRAGLLTGRYQTRFGHEFNPGGTTDGTEIGLPLSETTLADRLRSAGYATGLVGKWHLGSAEQFHPQKRGFDEFFGFLGGMHTYLCGVSADSFSRHDSGRGEGIPD